jgi:hypothetical protein
MISLLFSEGQPALPPGFLSCLQQLAAVFISFDSTVDAEIDWDEQAV